MARRQPSVTAFGGLTSDQWALVFMIGGFFIAVATGALSDLFDSWLPWQLLPVVLLLIIYSTWLCRWTFDGRDETTMFLRRRPHPLGRRTTVAIMPCAYNSERCTCIGCPSAGAFRPYQPSNYYWAHSGKLLRQDQEQMLQILRVTLAERDSNERRVDAAVKQLALPEEN